MVLANLSEVLSDARQQRIGVGCINVPSLEYARAAIAAAETVDAPIVLAHAEAHDRYVPLEAMAPSLLALARDASVPVVVHVDHGVSLDFIMRGVRAGFTSVMYDCSTLPVEDNGRRVGELVNLLRPIGVSVEAELGEMPSTIRDSHEDAKESDPEALLTDPGVAARYVEETGVDALAVSFGTSHGLYTGEPNLDFARLQQIDSATGSIPLVMHGSSGLPIADIRRAIECGISKVNYYSHLASDSSKSAAEWVAARQRDGKSVFHHEVMDQIYDYTKTEITRLLSAFKGLTGSMGATDS